MIHEECTRWLNPVPRVDSLAELHINASTSSYVERTVLDLLERIVTEVFDEHRVAGPHDLIFDAYDLPSGIYCYRLETDRYHASRLMTIMR